MKENARRAVAIVGMGAVLPDASDVATFWDNIKTGRYSIDDVPAGRWDPEKYFDPDPKAPDKTYSKIGGWIKTWEWDPLKWKLPIPPKVSEQMDRTQIWSISACRQALMDYGWPGRTIDQERTAVILGNAMAGDRHYMSAIRIFFPEYADELEGSPSFASLSGPLRKAILDELRSGIGRRIPEITEDTMPGELSNIIAGRVANVFGLNGPNYVVDAACASAMASIVAAISGLEDGSYDAVLTGGVDSNMSASSFTKFCKIGALSATGTRPYAEGADGFVMGEGAVVFMLKRLADAERDGDRIYAIIRGVGGASDGKGKGITAPNPVGQELCIRRAWENAGLSPDTVSLVEGHGTSTKVGDVIEAECLSKVFGVDGVRPGTIPLGSVKSNIGHLKGAAGSAGILKAVLALHHKVLPPSINFERPNPNIDFPRSPLYVNTELKPWDDYRGAVRRAGVSAFGFGGTNFHTVVEEYVPGRLETNGKVQVSLATSSQQGTGRPSGSSSAATLKNPLRGALVRGGQTLAEVQARLLEVQRDLDAGIVPPQAPPAEKDLRAPVRIAMDFGDAADLKAKLEKTFKAIQDNVSGRWKALRAQGIFLGEGEPLKAAFLFTGQGSQYVNMLKELKSVEPIVAETFSEADRVMEPILGRPLSSYIFIDADDPEAIKQLENDLRQTEITQPAVLATDIALLRVLASYGITPDMVMGHSLGEYAALVASGALSFADALRAVSARGHAMREVSMDDNGLMAAVTAPIDEVQKILEGIEGYVVIANINSTNQAVIGGATPSVQKAMQVIKEAGYRVVQLSVSHAFHTAIVGPASEPLARVLSQMDLRSPETPIVANVTGAFYPMGPGVKPEMVNILGKQVASPVQFVKGLNTLYDAGARVFVEVGPKRALFGFVEEVLESKDDITTLFTNHPRIGETTSINMTLCGFYAAGLGVGSVPEEARPAQPVVVPEPVVEKPASIQTRSVSSENRTYMQSEPTTPDSRYLELGKLFADFLEKGRQIYDGRPSSQPVRADEPVVITGAAFGLPGTESLFDDASLERLLRGDQFIDAIPMRYRQGMVDRNVTRLVKTEKGEPRFEYIRDRSEVVKLAGRVGKLDLVEEYGFPQDRIAALDSITRMALGAGIEALHDAGIPMGMHYKTTTTGSKLPVRWQLPTEVGDETGVIFACAFPGLDAFADENRRYYLDLARRQRLEDLQSLYARFVGTNHGSDTVVKEIERRINELRTEIESNAYELERTFLLRVLAMGHSQFAEFVGARGPNTQINAACASTTQAVSIAHDWIRAGRCRRVIIVASDNVTSDHLMDWFGAAFLASGVAATDELVEDAAVPFDRRRHGMIIGAGAAALVVESAETARKRGIRPICEVLSSVAKNSAFHATRLDIEHISQVMENLVSDAEQKWGIDRHQIAPSTVFVSHETYTPARGGSAAAEVASLRKVFGPSADRIVMANTKGFTGHTMAVGVEDVLAVKALETGLVPPVPNFKEVDPDLGQLNLSKGGAYPIYYALRLGAGFGSQISMSLLRWVPTPDGNRPGPRNLGYTGRIADVQAWNRWLSRISGYPSTELYVDKRTLRIRDQGAPSYPQVLPARTSQPLVQPAAPVAERAVTANPAATVPAPILPEVTVSKSPAPVVVAEPAGNAVKDRVLELVAAQTGYPVDMLDLDLDLEADLGVDTVKQAEMFAAVRNEYGIPRDENLRLRDFPTLAHVIQFVYDRKPELQVSVITAPSVPLPSTSPAEPTPVTTVRPQDGVREKVLQLVSEQTGYPVDMLDPELDLEADLGIDTVKQAEMFAAVRQAWGIERDENLQLRNFPTLEHVIQFVYDKRPDLLQAAPAPAVLEAPVVPVVSVPAPSDEPAREIQTVQAATPADDSVKNRILQVVADQTGYPVDMLDLDLDLEADLGIDTVKQAEMFAAVRGVYDIPRDENLQLRDYPTLGHVITFVYEKRPDLQQTTVPAPVQPETHTETHIPAVQHHAANRHDPIDDPVKMKVLELVSLQTGYPADMLELDLDLEADLGIDTVKQAEMFAAVRHEFGIPRDENLQLRDYPTLGHVIRFVYDHAPTFGDGSDHSEVTVSESGSLQEAGTAGHHLEGSLKAAASIPRRVVVPVPRPPLMLCKSTGVALDETTRVIVVPDRGGVGAALIKRLEKKNVQVLVIDDAPPAEELEERLKAWSAEGPIHGVYWLPALDEEEPIGTLSPETWKENLRVRVKLLYTTMRALYAGYEETGAFLVAGTRMGGQHGYGESGASAPMGGAVTGFCKTFKRERYHALVKVVDFEPSKKTAAYADLLIDETLSDPGIVEVGYKDGLRWSVSFEDRPLGPEHTGMKLDAGTVFLVTGAAGSIVSAITRDLAQASGGVFYLLDLVPQPDPSDPDLNRYVSDRENLKRDLFERIKARGERATPALVEKELARLERLHSALTAIQAVEKAGGTVFYHAVNLLDYDAVAGVIAKVRQQHGKIDVLLHAGGLEISRFLPDKQPAEYDLVFDVKVNGWFNLVHAIGDMPLGATVAFSSVAGRFGNAGQSDYSAANDLLCKWASNFRTTRPGTRGIALDWTAWGGIGMATRGSIPKMMELAGIDMLPPEAGVPYIRRELIASTFKGEIVVGSELGVLVKEWDETGGLSDNLVTGGLPGPMTNGTAVLNLYEGLTIQTELDPAEQNFLDHHRIDGVPVLPGVMGIEGFVEAATVLFPGWQVESVEDVQFLAPFKFYRDEPRTVTLNVRYTVENSDLVAVCCLTGTRQLPNKVETTRHFVGKVRLSARPLETRMEAAPAGHSGVLVSRDDIYRIYFHGPAYQVLAQAWKENASTIGEWKHGLPANHTPDEAPLRIMPRLIELCFQTAGVREIATSGLLALPRFVRRISAFRDSLVSSGKLYAVVTQAEGRTFDVSVVDEKGSVYLTVEGYETIELPGSIDPEAKKPLEAAIVS